MADLSSLVSIGKDIFYLLPGEAGEGENLLIWALGRCSIADRPFELIPIYCLDCRCKWIGVAVLDLEGSQDNPFTKFYKLSFDDGTGKHSLQILNQDSELALKLFPIVYEIIRTESEYRDRLIEMQKLLKKVRAVVCQDGVGNDSQPATMRALNSYNDLDGF